MFNNIEEAIEDIKLGKMIVVIDDYDRENEGDLLMAADMVTPEAINFMAKYGRGLICTPMSEELLDNLNIMPMVSKNTDNHETAFTVSVDYKDTETGISAFERALTIKKLLDKDLKENDFKRPGHVFPLRAKKFGTLERNGHTEAAIDFASLAGFNKAGVICEIISEDGHMARTEELIKFSKKHNLKIVTIKDLIEYRKKKECLVERVVETKLPTKYGDFNILGYKESLNDKEHIALVKGNINCDEPVLVRIHSECLTGDTFGSKRCDCGEQYEVAIRKIEKEGCGVLIYMKQEGRGIGLLNKLKAYSLQDKGYDTVEANIKLGYLPDMREYSITAGILKDLGIKNVRLMTNNPSKINGLREYGINVLERVPIIMEANEIDREYLKVKKVKMEHML